MIDPGRGVPTLSPNEASKPNPPRPDGVCLCVCVCVAVCECVCECVRVSHIIYWLIAMIQPVVTKRHSKQGVY